MFKWFKREPSVIEKVREAAENAYQEQYQEVLDGIEFSAKKGRKSHQQISDYGEQLHEYVIERLKKDGFIVLNEQYKQDRDGFGYGYNSVLTIAWDDVKLEEMV